MTNRFITSAILLAAGLGTRMQPITATRPKPLIEVNGKALIDHVIDNLSAEGINQFAVNTHYMQTHIEAHLTKLAHEWPDKQFALSPEPKTLLGTGGGAKKAMKLIGGDPLLITNTDAFWPLGADTPIARLAAQYQVHQGITLLCAPPMRATDFRRSHDFCLAPDKKITSDRGAPVIYTGVALMPRHLLEQYPAQIFSTHDLMMAAKEQGNLHGVLLNAVWHHVGDPAAIAEAAVT